MDSRLLFIGLLLIVMTVTAGEKTPYEDVRYHVISDETLSSIDSFYNVHSTLDQFGRNKRQNDNINITTMFDHHRYYTSRYIPPGTSADDLWFELGNLIGSGAELQTNVFESVLQGLHRYLQVWTLKFDFPFYGHFVDTLAVTTGGFLYMSDFLHEQVHLTQFVAPLQADFNPSLHDTAKIYVYNAIERFTVQWDQVHNHDHVSDGPFTFQVSLFPNGTIVFAYREIPLPVSQLNNSDHPVEVGLADALYVDVIFENFILRSIYEYSRIQLNATDNLTNSAYIITPVPNCVIANDCDQCIAITEEGNFNCSWCPDINRCSDGLDRYTQEWFISGCDKEAIYNCAIPSTHTTLSSSTSTVTHTTLSSSTSTVTHTTLSSSTSTVTHATLSSFTSTVTHTTLSSSTSTVTHTTLSSSTITVTHITIEISTTVASTTVASSTHTTSIIQSSSPSFTPTSAPSSAPSSTLSSGAIAGISVAILLIIIVIIVFFIVIGVLVYGYKNPTSRLGLFMIEHRPSVWCLNKSKTHEVKGEKVLLEEL